MIEGRVSQDFADLNRHGRVVVRAAVRLNVVQSEVAILVQHDLSVVDF